MAPTPTTVESNLIVLATALVLVRRPGFDGRVWRVVRRDALPGILTTGLVFASVLARQVHLPGARRGVRPALQALRPHGAALLKPLPS
ncbi:hypothetical protein [Amycolatopsis sp. NBC_00438]|uniref:hypothetical protein n=1 Tax=Amycolatopsis sp. NBC_00438 TaxID=2903558 RepID=UPI002E1C871B